MKSNTKLRNISIHVIQDEGKTINLYTSPRVRLNTFLKGGAEA